MTCIPNKRPSFEDLANLFPSSKDSFVKDVKDSKILGVPFLSMLDRCLDNALQSNYRKSLSLCECLLDMAWEKLNTGYWKDVHMDWRRAYTVVSVVKVFSQCYLLKEKSDKDDLEAAGDKNKEMVVDHENYILVEAYENKTVKDNQNETVVRNTQETLVKENENETLVTDEHNKTSVQDNQNEMSVKYNPNETLVKDKQNETLVKDYRNETLIKCEKSRTFVADDENRRLEDETDQKARADEETKTTTTLDADDGNTSIANRKTKVPETENYKNSRTLEYTTANRKTKVPEPEKDNMLLAAEISIADILKSCDMGLLMGAPILDNILSKLSTKIITVFVNPRKRKLSTRATKLDESVDKQAKVDERNEQDIVDAACMVGKVSCPSLESFKKKYMDTGTPVIVKDAIDFWPALGERKWTLDYLKEMAGYRTVPIELGSKYTEDSWSQDLMTVKDFIENYIENQTTAPKGYLAQHQLFEQVPELQNDIVIPTYCCLGDVDDVETNAWFGPKGTVSPLHYDAKHNLLAQIVGEKYIRLFSNEHANRLYPHPDRLLFNTSQVDVEAPDLQKFPQFAGVPYKECVLHTGEMLYIPPKYWHFVRSLSVSFSVSFWWE